MRQELERLLGHAPGAAPGDAAAGLLQTAVPAGIRVRPHGPAPETAGRHLMEEYARAAGLPGRRRRAGACKGAALPGCVEDIGNGCAASI